MLDGTTGFLLAALLVIPTCIGLWRGDNVTSTEDPERMKRLLDRRRGNRRRATRTGKDARVNYFFLETHDPARAHAPENPESRWDRRRRDRRAEDTARGSSLLESTMMESTKIARWVPETLQPQTLSAGPEPIIEMATMTLPLRSNPSTTPPTRRDPA
jgi:hypothetical protein